MSIVLYGGGVLDARGSVGGTTMSRSKFGPTHRAKISPIQPKSPFQGVSRSLLSNISRRWSSDLTTAEQAAWNSYALTNPKTNVLGQTAYLSGHQTFVAYNANIFNTGGTFIFSPPVGLSEPGLSSLSITASHTPGSVLKLTFTNPPIPGVPVVYVMATQSLSPGVSYVNNKFKFIGAQVLAASPMDFEADYIARFGNVYPVISKRLFVLVSIVDQAAGLQSAGIIASAIIT